MKRTVNWVAGLLLALFLVGYLSAGAHNGVIILMVVVAFVIIYSISRCLAARAEKHGHYPQQ